MGGAYPYEPLAAVFSPPLLGLVPATEPSLICRDAIPDAIPLGAMGAMGQGPKGLGNLEVNLLPSIDPCCLASLSPLY